MNDYFTRRQQCPSCESTKGTELRRTPYTANPLRDYLVSFYSPQGGVELDYLENQDYVLVECGQCRIIYRTKSLMTSSCTSSTSSGLIRVNASSSTKANVAFSTFRDVLGRELHREQHARRAPCRPTTPASRPRRGRRDQSPEKRAWSRARTRRARTRRPTTASTSARRKGNARACGPAGSRSRARTRGPDRGLVQRVESAGPEPERRLSRIARHDTQRHRLRIAMAGAAERAESRAEPWPSRRRRPPSRGRSAGGAACVCVPGLLLGRSRRLRRARPGQGHGRDGSMRRRLRRRVDVLEPVEVARAVREARVAEA